ncbi:ParB/RepB/Spo0J family partition protein [Kocuria massiliensis]|uniref:ParB/RepB/Spo0J family partition protein n=1 Tax=Kocuria massiliensis TaxID=1926282 RepID=UPI0022B98049|nr:ParB/RepB/Spo0J family partition protein [Kocuria massiliensis]
MAERRRGLGRGLGSLIPTASEQEVNNEADKQAATASKEASVSRETKPGPDEPAENRSGKGGKGSTAGAKTSSSSSSRTQSTTTRSAKKSAPAVKKADDAKKAQTGVTSSKGETPVSRETQSSGGQRKASTAQKSQTRKSAGARADMGAALRKSSGGRRPVDFFFQPSEAIQEQKSGAESAEEPPKDGTPWSSEDDVSRETHKPGVQDGERSKPGAKTKKAGEGDDQSGSEELVNVPGAQFGEIPVGEIHPNRKQPRQEFDEDEMEELIHSIREIGLLQPIVVRPSSEEGTEKYELVMGERRWRATQRAGLKTIPAIVRDTQDVDLLRDALLENLHRSQLNPLEEAAAYQQLLNEFGTTQDELAQRIGRSRPQISNTIRLLRLPALVQRRVAAGILSAGHARALLSLSDPAAMEKLAQRIVAEGLSVRTVEEIIQSGAAEKQEKPARKPVTPHRHHERLDYIADAFADKLDTSVKINLGSRKGKMTIEFASVEDLNRIISVLDPEIEGE